MCWPRKDFAMHSEEIAFLKPNNCAHTSAAGLLCHEPLAWLQMRKLEIWHRSVIQGHLNVWDMTKYLSISSSRNPFKLLHVRAAFLPSMAK